MSAAYLVLVGVLFLIARLYLDDDRASFIPVFLATLPGSFAFLLLDLPRPLIFALTMYYDLPLFVISAVVNITFGASLLARKESS